MKKIIAAFDGLKFSESTLQHAISLAREKDAHLVGVFLEDFTYYSYKIYELVTEKGVSTQKLKAFEKKDTETRQESVEYFEKACTEAGLNFSIHRDRKIALKELLHESLFADLLIIDANETLTHYDESLPTRFIKNLLHEAMCPVLLVPHKYKTFEKVVLLYDGSVASVNAIKLFSYLLPGMRKKDMEMLCIKPPGDSAHLPDNKLVKEWIKRHFPECKFTVLQGEPLTEIETIARTITAGVLFVTGSYKRGSLSMLWRPSLADFLMKKIKTPVFIAHS